MIDSRRKGRLGEQELARLLRDEIGETITRNWQAQSAIGGQDIVGLPGFAIEVKRYASATYADLERWWTQTVRQARPGETPILAYREDRCPRQANVCDVPRDQRGCVRRAREAIAARSGRVIVRGSLAEAMHVGSSKPDAFLAPGPL